MALYSLYCAEVPLRNCSLTHAGKHKDVTSYVINEFYTRPGTCENNDFIELVDLGVETSVHTDEHYATWTVDTHSITAKNNTQISAAEYFVLPSTASFVLY